MSDSSDPNIGEIHGIILEGAGGVCRTCGFRYWEHRGHILACPVCALAKAEAMCLHLRGELNGMTEQCNDARSALTEANERRQETVAMCEQLRGDLAKVERQGEMLTNALSLLLHNVRIIMDSEPPDRSIPAQLLAGDIRQARAALAAAEETGG